MDPRTDSNRIQRRIQAKIQGRTKGQIQKAFEEVRNALALKEKEILAKCDVNLQESLEDLDKGVRAIVKRI